jgi:hypothetical protein
MSGTNFDLAPPAKIVDGLMAVPIDIQQITANLSFDGATSYGAGDATLDFVVGPQGGNPIFDLRQTITGLWLDGAPMAVAQAAEHDFGGGPHAELRILESVLAAGSSHTLRLTYALGPPQASTAGTYQPGMTWIPGPRLVFNFGFTDLGAGRYLEAWIPANLIFDQFALALDLQVLNSAIAHTVITNGAVTAIGPNHWHVVYPDNFTALSPLLELRATDSLTNIEANVTLPISGSSVTVEGWKLATSASDLAGSVSNVETWLGDDESAIGPYLHGDRFVLFLNVGGMEYEGGATAGVSALRHETYHSWWGRGVKPASQPDGWIDEAWNVYHDLGGTGSLPFDFTQPPVELCTRNPWSRVTPGTAYTSGERFFEGVAASIGVAHLASAMSAFYNAHTDRPITTLELEEFIVSRSGEALLVDAFDRFVYGFGDPSPAPDLWLRDEPGDPGLDVWPGRFWDSPDLWIRRTDDGGTVHQPPQYGQDNWFYARVRNRSTTAPARHYLVTFNVKPWAGVEFLFPGDFLPCVAAAGGFDLPPGGDTVVKARWPAALVPAPGTHACWLAGVFTRLDAPTPGSHVWERNNLAQKNLTVVDLAPGEWIVIPFTLRNLAPRVASHTVLELIRPDGLPTLEATLLRPMAIHAKPEIDRDTLDCGAGIPHKPQSVEMWTSSNPNAAIRGAFAKAAEIAFQSGKVASVTVPLPPTQQGLLGVRVRAPRGSRSGKAFILDLVQRDNDRRVLGGIALRVNVVSRQPAAQRTARTSP